MIDLHTHTLWSDGELIPSEHIRRACHKGYKSIAITDHADSSNIEILCKESIAFARKMNQIQDEIYVISGIEITHVLPDEINDLTEFAKKSGIGIVVVHGETIAEPVREKTNLAAIKAKVDILAHPGLISEEEVELARKNNVYLEITSRKGHCLTNGHVAKLALKFGASLVIDTDSHTSDDFISREKALKILLGAGIPLEYTEAIFNNSKSIVEKIAKSL